MIRRRTLRDGQEIDVKLWQATATSEHPRLLCYSVRWLSGIRRQENFEAATLEELYRVSPSNAEQFLLPLFDEWGLKLSGLVDPLRVRMAFPELARTLTAEERQKARSIHHDLGADFHTRIAAQEKLLTLDPELLLELAKYESDPEQRTSIEIAMRARLRGYPAKPEDLRKHIPFILHCLNDQRPEVNQVVRTEAFKNLLTTFDAKDTSPYERIRLDYFQAEYLREYNELRARYVSAED